MKIYLTSSDNTHSLLDTLLKETLGDYVITKNKYGKPYIQGNAIYFNISHSGAFGLIALSEKPVGADIEAVVGRNHLNIINCFNEREKSEINSEIDFLEHFTAREAFVKNLGESLFVFYKRLSYEKGNIYLDGLKQDCNIITLKHEKYVMSLCGEGKIELFENRI